MKTYLVTGGAGFIGSNFVLYMLNKYEDIIIINLDKLTYAGNLENLKSIQDDPRHIFVHGDICDAELVSSLFEKYEIDYVAHFAAESHVDNSIKTPFVFTKTNVLGTHTLLETAKHSIYQVDIEKEFGLRPPTVTETLKTLEKKDLIRRIPDENDGRKKKIIITEKTLSMDDGVKWQVEKSEEVLLQDITEAEQQQFMKIAEKMLKNLESYNKKEDRKDT